MGDFDQFSAPVPARPSVRPSVLSPPRVPQTESWLVTFVCRCVLACCRLQMLAAEVDAIIHSGASVNLVRSYGSLKPVNVLGTQVRCRSGVDVSLLICILRRVCVVVEMGVM